MAPPPRSYDLPHSFPAAILRGFLGKCPRCGEGRLFRAWLKPKDHCPCCALDLREQRSDDFPAYVAIFITGHVLAPILIMLVLDFELSILALTIIVFAMAIAMLMALIQPSKGAVIALQWWNGMHGFKRERVFSEDGEP